MARGPYSLYGSVAESSEGHPVGMSGDAVGSTAESGSGQPAENSGDVVGSTSGSGEEQAKG